MAQCQHSQSSGTCCGGLEKSSFLSFSWSWILLCLGWDSWFVDWFVDCWDWEQQDSLLGAWLATSFTSLVWTVSFDFADWERHINFRHRTSGLWLLEETIKWKWNIWIALYQYIHTPVAGCKDEQHDSFLNMKSKELNSPIVAGHPSLHRVIKINAIKPQCLEEKVCGAGDNVTHRDISNQTSQ